MGKTNDKYPTGDEKNTRPSVKRLGLDTRGAKKVNIEYYPLRRYELLGERRIMDTDCGQLIRPREETLRTPSLRSQASFHALKSVGTSIVNFRSIES